MTITDKPVNIAFSYESSRENWLMWTRQIGEKIASRDIAGAADFLAMCLEEPGGPTDLKMQNFMFRRWNLKPHHQFLWDRMRPQITIRFRQLVYYRLKYRWGWHI